MNKCEHVLIVKFVPKLPTVQSNILGISCTQIIYAFYSRLCNYVAQCGIAKLGSYVTLPGGEVPLRDICSTRCTGYSPSPLSRYSTHPIPLLNTPYRPTQHTLSPYSIPYNTSLRVHTVPRLSHSLSNR